MARRGVVIKDFSVDDIASVDSISDPWWSLIVEGKYMHCVRGPNSRHGDIELTVREDCSGQEEPDLAKCLTLSGE